MVMAYARVHALPKAAVCKAFAGLTGSKRTTVIVLNRNGRQVDAFEAADVDPAIALPFGSVPSA